MDDHAHPEADERMTTDDGLPLGTVTFLLTDIESSTPRWDLEPVAMAAAIEMHDQLLDRAIAAQGGLRPREQGEGDSVVAVFTRASDAVRAARDAQRALADATWPTQEPVRVRMGLHAGEAGYSTSVGYTGTSIIRAARIRSLARGGEVLISETVRALAADDLDGETLVDLGPHELDGLLRPERIWRLTTTTDLPASTPRSTRGRRHNLPAWPATFVGRVDDIASLRTCLSQEAIVTVVGPGGGGKTRLAQQVALREAEQRRDGSWWLDLVTVSDGSILAATLAGLLELNLDLDDPLGALCRGLAHSDRLLVLDNCEHLVDEVSPVVAALSASCPGLGVLATSRAPLGVAGELVWTIPPLATADATHLFVERARHVRHNFVVDDDSRPVIAAICDRLDGIPLPIELAAARCKVLSPAQVLRGLEDAIGLLTGGARTSLARHQTIEASIAWSHGLLQPPEQLLLRRLSVFESTFSLDAVEGVCADDQLPRAELLGMLERLVDHSMVQTADIRGELRFRLLETVRQFARHALAGAGGDAALIERHTTWFTARGRECHPLYRPEMVAILNRLDDDRLDILAALGRVIGSPHASDVAALSLGVLPALDVRHPAEAAEWAERVAAALGQHSSRDYGLLSVRLAEIAFVQGDADAAERAMATALRIADELPDAEVGACAQALQVTWAGIADPRLGAQLAPLAETTCREAGADHDANSLIWMGAGWESIVGDRPAATASFERAAREIRDECPRCAALRQLGWAKFELERGQLLGARKLAVAGRHANRELADRPTEGGAVGTLAALGIVAGSRDSTVEDEVRTEWAWALAAHNGYALYFLGQHVAMLAAADGDIALLRQVLSFQHIVDMPPWAQPDLVDAIVATLANDGAQVEASAHMAAALASLAEHAPSRSVAIFEHRAGTLAMLADDVERAEAHAYRALDAACSGPWPAATITSLELIAVTATHRGWDEFAARLTGAAAAHRASTGIMGSFDPERTLLRDALAVCRQRSGDEAIQRELDAGAGLGWHEAAEYARRTHGERRRPNFGWDALTPTERQVAELAARGLTNPQIAQQLLMGRETVKSHLSSVYTKTGVANRTQLAATLPTVTPPHPRSGNL